MTFIVIESTPGYMLASGWPAEFAASTRTPWRTRTSSSDELEERCELHNGSLLGGPVRATVERRGDGVRDPDTVRASGPWPLERVWSLTTV